MCPNSEFRERIDTLDLIINVLKEHEKILDGLAEKLEGIADRLKTREAGGKEIRDSLSLIENEISSLNEAFSRLSLAKLPESARLVSVQCKEWKDFRAKSRGAHRVAFEMEEKVFTVNSLVNGEVFNYSEVLAEHELRAKKEEKGYLIEKMFVDNLEEAPLFFKNQLRCGLGVSIRSSKFSLPDGEYVFKLAYDVDSDQAKHWLSKELEVPEENIVEGKITF